MRARAFTLLELLVALGILAILAAIVSPYYLDLKRKAMWVAATNMETDFNNTLANWKSAGGTMGTNVYTSDMLDLLASGGQYSFMPDDPARKITDGGNSQTMRMSVSPSTHTDLPMRGCMSDSSGQFLVVFNNAMQYFGVVPVIDGKIPYYYWGTGDSCRNILDMAVGSTTVIVLQVGNNLCYDMQSFDYRVMADGSTVAQAIEQGVLLPSVKDPEKNVGPDPAPWLNRSIETFSKHLDGSGNPIISEKYCINEDFFAESESAAKWTAAKSALQ